MIAAGQSRRTLMSFRKSRLHKCACPQCAAEIGTGMLMCRIHWFQLPARLREDINNARDACKRVGIPHSAELHALRDQAVAFHKQQPELLT